MARTSADILSTVSIVCKINGFQFLYVGCHPGGLNYIRCVDVALRYTVCVVAESCTVI
jgi:hypothetical protein